MLVGESEVINTIGGGHLEHEVIAQARERLLRGGLQASNSVTNSIIDSPASRASSLTSESDTLRFALGPSLGQCCGGVVHVTLQLVDAATWETQTQTLLQQCQPVALFGGGHVGRAIVHLLGTLPYAVQWFDSRDEIFPQVLPLNVQAEHSDPVQAAVADLPAQSHVLIMSFSHAEDLDVVAACLQRQRERGDLRFIGLIGSKTKWATFKRRLLERGFGEQELAQVTCPIGVPGITGKEPEVIAVAVVAQLLGLG
jgi:xanthine dehydrogenase accessory factor